MSSDGITGNQIFTSGVFKGGGLGFSEVGAFKIDKLLNAMEVFESLVASDVAYFASCPAKVSVGLMLQMQLKINKMVQTNNLISNLLSNLNSMASTTIQNSKSQ